jgi:hypothetical protein
VSATRTSAGTLLLTVAILAVGTWLWLGHARAWDLGRGSPVLGYDAAEYAVAARELAYRGQLATLYALPIELARHANPPWPLALVQPGLVVADALLFRIVPGAPEWLVLLLPFACYLGCALLLAWITRRLIARHGATGIVARDGAALLIAIAFLLAPEGQHLATGGFTELPYTLGLIAAFGLVALGLASRRPLLFGLLLGVTGAFRANMLWTAPALAAAAAWCAPEKQRARAFVFVMLGYALPLAPWWIYKWHAFGTPGWDLSALSLWDGVGGRTWFSLNHLPYDPAVPHGGEAVRLVAAKIARNLPGLLANLTAGPRGLWIGSLIVFAALLRPPATLAAAAWAAIAALAIGTLVAAASVPLVRYLFPSASVIDAAGVLALLYLISRAPVSMIGETIRPGIWVGVGLIALGWGAWSTEHGQAEARMGARTRGIPTGASLAALADTLARESPGHEPVMSNLGPILAWYARRPVVHLALAPRELEACRRRLDTRIVLLVFRDVARVWPEWTEVFDHPASAAHTPEWNVSSVATFRTGDGFQVVRLELGPLDPSMAGADQRTMARRRVIATPFTVTRAR